MHNLTNHEHPRPLDVIGLGLATLDILVRFESLPTWEHGARFERIAFDGGGPVATALVAASRLGLRVGYVGTAGQDEFAERKLRSLQESGIDTSRVVRRPGDERQIVICCVRSTDGERVFCGHETLRTDPLRADELDRAYVCSAPLVHLDGFHPDAASQTARSVKQAGGTVILDAHTGERASSPWWQEILAFTDVYIGSRGAFSAATGRCEPHDAGRALLGRGPTIAVETMGCDGCFAVTAHESFHAPGFEVDVVDTTGAGDAFHGAFITGLHYGWDVHTACLFANAVSALSCTALGGRRGLPTLEQTIAFLEQRGYNVPNTGDMERS